MTNDIRSLLSKIDQINEADITPVKVTPGLNAQQKKAPQMPALFRPKSISVLGADKDPEHPARKFFVGAESEETEEEAVTEAHATEDVVTTDRKRLGDYLQDVAQAIKKDPELLDKIPQMLDKLGPAVKTLRTDDGHEIKIHGNEDDGFRITIKNRPSRSHFKSLDEATVAVEMFCARRQQNNSNQDYLDEVK